MKLKVEESNIRIDKYLVNILNKSRSLIQKMIEENYILVNGNPTKCNYVISINDIIDVNENFEQTQEIKAQNIDLNIVYEDNDLIIINKPTGMVVHPGNGNKENTLVNALVGYTNELSDDNGDIRPGIVHRIDKDTSGLMVVAKNNKTHEILADAFKYKKIKREYIALLIGELMTDTATIDAPIGRDKNERKRMTVTSLNSKKAVTHLEVVKRYKGYTLVKLNLETGRTHQIRVHMKYIGFPIFNDPVYSNSSKTSFGQFLHSSSIDFVHPISLEHMHFECDLPNDFSDYLNKLDNI